MIVSIISQGFVWAILGLGIFMTFRILNFPDMTTEGSFPLGGAVAVTLITKGVNPFLATLVAVGAGCLAGMAAGLLYTKGKIPTLLSGILVMTSCHSIMLLIMGRANLGLLGTKQIQDVLPFDSDLNQLLTGLIFVSIVIALMLFFLDTKLGQAYIATGDNPDMARSFGIHTGRMEAHGLGLIKWCDCPCRCPHCSARRLCRCVSRDRGYRCGACKFDYWRSYFQEFELGRAFGYYRCRFYRLSIFSVGSYRTWL